MSFIYSLLNCSFFLLLFFLGLLQVDKQSECLLRTKVVIKHLKGKVPREIDGLSYFQNTIQVSFPCYHTELRPKSSPAWKRESIKKLQKSVYLLNNLLRTCCMFIQSQLLQNGRNSAPRAEYSAALKQGAQRLPRAAAPAPRAFCTSGFLPQLQLQVHHRPHAHHIGYNGHDALTKGCGLYRGSSQASQEKSCDTKCQLGCHIRSVFTRVLGFDSFGNREQNKDLWNSGQSNRHEIHALYSSGRPGMGLLATFEP